jgi:di/tricarboxylate transporter
LKQSPKRYLMPLSYVAVLGGCCTLIGTSTNLLVNDMARVAGQPQFGLFEITPVGLAIALSGGLYLFLFSGRLISADTGKRSKARIAPPSHEPHLTGEQLGSAELFAKHRPLQPVKALASVTVFVVVIAVAALEIVPIAASASPVRCCSSCCEF